MLEVNELKKSVGGATALDAVSFSFEDGGIHIILGPDGAGKSTLFDILSGCCAADGGTVLFDGEEMSPSAVRLKRKIGYMPQDVPIYGDMTVEEYLVFVAKAKGVSADKLYKNVNSAMELTMLNSISSRLLKKLISGEIKLVGLAAAMLGNPNVILIDEPMTYMTSTQKLCFKDLVKKLGAIKTVIIAARSLSEYGELCDDLMIMSHGRIIAHDTRESIEEKLRSVKTLSLTVRGNEEKILSALSSVSSITACTVSEGVGDAVSIKIETSSEGDIRDEVFAALADASCPILSMESTSLTLDDIYARLAGDKNTMGGDKR